MNRLAFLAAVLTVCGVGWAQLLDTPLSQQTPPPPANPQGQPAPAPTYYYPVQTPQAPWQYDITFAGGYTNLIFDHANNGAHYEHDGAYIDFGAAFNLPQFDPIRFGAGITASGYWDNTQFDFQSLYSEVNNVAIEARVLLPLAADHDRGFFFTPRIGAGGLVDNYYAETPFGGSLNHTGLAVEVRPGIQVGYRFLPGGTAAAGLDASYMAAWGDFGDFGTFCQEVRIGAFFSWRF